MPIFNRCAIGIVAHRAFVPHQRTLHRQTIFLTLPNQHIPVSFLSSECPPGGRFGV
jgi:hypothetical protein